MYRKEKCYVNETANNNNNNITSDDFGATVVCKTKALRNIANNHRDMHRAALSNTCATSDEILLCISEDEKYVQQSGFQEDTPTWTNLICVTTDENNNNWLLEY